MTRSPINWIVSVLMANLIQSKSTFLNEYLCTYIYNDQFRWNQNIFLIKNLYKTKHATDNIISEKPLTIAYISRWFVGCGFHLSDGHYFILRFHSNLLKPTLLKKYIFFFFFRKLKLQSIQHNVYNKQFLWQIYWRG